MVIQGGCVPSSVHDGRVISHDAGFVRIRFIEDGSIREIGLGENWGGRIGCPVIVETHGRGVHTKHRVRPVTHYQERIAEICSCNFSTATVVERGMRDSSPTLDHLTLGQFGALAREVLREIEANRPGSA